VKRREVASSGDVWGLDYSAGGVEPAWVLRLWSKDCREETDETAFIKVELQFDEVIALRRLIDRWTNDVSPRRGESATHIIVDEAGPAFFPTGGTLQALADAGRIDVIRPDDDGSLLGRRVKYRHMAFGVDHEGVVRDVSSNVRWVIVERDDKILDRVDLSEVDVRVTS
jgi:hypothetical protein